MCYDGSRNERANLFLDLQVLGVCYLVWMSLRSVRGKDQAALFSDREAFSPPIDQRSKSLAGPKWDHLSLSKPRYVFDGSFPPQVPLVISRIFTYRYLAYSSILLSSLLLRY
jgi:hypothetical protein